MLTAQESLKSMLQKAAKLFPSISRKRQFKNINIIFCNDPEQEAGRSWQATSTIELNLAYFEKNLTEMTNQILGHELCHIITDILTEGNAPWHGMGWQTIMTTMGFRPEEYHNMEV